MDLSYKTNKLEKSLTTDKGLAKTYGLLAKKIKQRINELNAADNLGIIYKIPAMRLHPYKGRDKGIWSIDIYKNWRILFTIENDPIPTLDDGTVDLYAISSICIYEIKDPH